MADTLIETVSSNPYQNIVADTSSQIADVDAQIQQVSSAINKLEQVSPTSPTLSQLRERLSSLQERRRWLSTTNDSAKSLMNSYNQSVANVSTLTWIYQLKDSDIWAARNESNAQFNQMEADTRRMWDNYVNTLQNATASENAIINANAWRQWASSQSTAEVRARNYLNAAAAWNEAANQTQQNINAIWEWRINTNAWYLQLSQSNADNTLRQQVMNDFQASEAQKDRDFQERLTDKQLSTQRAISSSYNNNNNNTLDPSKFSKEDWENIFKYYNDHSKEDTDEEKNK